MHRLVRLDDVQRALACVELQGALREAALPIPQRPEEQLTTACVLFFGSTSPRSDDAIMKLKLE